MAKNVKIQRDDEYVVHRQRLFDHEARQVREPAGRAKVPPYPGAETQRHRDVPRGQQQTFSHADLVVVLVEHAQVEGQQGRDNACEQQPDPNGLAQEVDGEKLSDVFHEG